MPRRFVVLARSAALCAYLLIILGGVVRITGSGLGCGEHWPLCNGRLFPPLDLPTWIEWSHRLVAGALTGLVVVLAAYAWRSEALRDASCAVGRRASYVALGLLIVQISLGAITVKLSLPPWTGILHLGTAMLLLGALLVAARTGPTPGVSRGLVVPQALAFVTVLLGALTANLGAASACLGFPLCNGSLAPAGNDLQAVHWIHRLLAYTLAVYVLMWALRRRTVRTGVVSGLVTLQVMVGATMVLGGLPKPLRVAHVAVGTAIWAALVF